MVAFLAAIPALFAAMKGAAEVFDLGKKVVEEVTGKSSSAQDPKGLKEEVELLSADQQSAFVARMQEELQIYEAISARLSQQGGQVDAQTLETLPQDQRGRIAFLRMTTRPWAVRWMVVAVVFPPLATVGMNLLIAFYNVLNKAWAVQPHLIAQIEPGMVLNELYLSMVGWAAGVIMTYMGMREIGKAVGHSDEVGLRDVTGTLGRVYQAMKTVFVR